MNVLTLLARVPWDTVIGIGVGLAGLIFGTKKASEAKKLLRAGQAMASVIYRKGAKDVAEGIKAQRKDSPEIGEVISKIVESIAANVLDPEDNE